MGSEDVGEGTIVVLTGLVGLECTANVSKMRKLGVTIRENVSIKTGFHCQYWYNADLQVHQQMTDPCTCNLEPEQQSVFKANV